MRYRIYDNVDKKYFESEVIEVFLDQKGELIFFNKEHRKSWCDSSDRYTVEESTGLKDKNGVDIYEGDTIVFDDGFTKFSKKYDVRLTKGCCWNIWHKDTEKINCSLYHAVFDHGIKIIGNIHGGLPDEYKEVE